MIFIGVFSSKRVVLLKIMEKQAHVCRNTKLNHDALFGFFTVWDDSGKIKMSLLPPTKICRAGKKRIEIFRSTVGFCRQEVVEYLSKIEFFNKTN